MDDLENLVTSNLDIHRPIGRPLKARLFVRQVMPVVHSRATDMTENEPENRRENRLECWIHDGKINREEGLSNENQHLSGFDERAEGVCKFLQHALA